MFSSGNRIYILHFSESSLSHSDSDLFLPSSSLHFDCLLNNSTVMAHKHFKLSMIKHLSSDPLPVSHASAQGNTTILPDTHAWNLPVIWYILLCYSLPSAFPSIWHVPCPYEVSETREIFDPSLQTLECSKDLKSPETRDQLKHRYRKL